MDFLYTVFGLFVVLCTVAHNKPELYENRVLPICFLGSVLLISVLLAWYLFLLSAKERLLPFIDGAKVGEFYDFINSCIPGPIYWITLIVFMIAIVPLKLISSSKES